MTRARCAECGASLACKIIKQAVNDGYVLEVEVHPCGACLQEARADAIAGYAADREPPVDEGRD